MQRSGRGVRVRVYQARLSQEIPDGADEKCAVPEGVNRTVEAEPVVEGHAEYQRVGGQEPAGVVGDDQCSAGWKGVEPAHLGAEPYLGDGPTCSDELGHRAGIPVGGVGFAHSHPPWHMISERRYIAESGTNIRVP